MTGIPKRASYLAIVLTCIAVAVMFPAQYLVSGIDGAAQNGSGLASAYSDRAPWVRAVLYLHIVAAGIALLLVPCQFLRALRNRLPVIHRVIGRTYAVAVVVGGIAGFVLAIFGSAGLNGFFGFGALAVLWVVCTVKGVLAARGGHIAQHRAWMTRSFALTYAAVTLRLWQVVLMASLSAWGFEGDIFATAYAAVPFLCWVPNIVVAEVLVYRRGLPGLRYVGTA